MFSFIDTLGNYNEVEDDDLIMIHTSSLVDTKKFPKAAMITVNRPEGHTVTGAFEHAEELVSRFNEETKSSDKLVQIKNTKYFQARKQSSLPDGMYHANS